MGDNGATDEEIAADFRAWLELAEDAPREKVWAARPSRVAVHRRLRADVGTIEFIEVLLNSATGERSMALICETIVDAIEHRLPYATHAVFERSDAEPWATLSLHLFGSGELEGRPDSHVNRSQAAEAFVWLGGELDPGEKREDRYYWPAWTKVESLLDDPDPLPMLRYLVDLAQDEAELWHVLIGPFETVCYARPSLREAVAALPGVTPEFAEQLRTLG
jgi:hypothetical protein